MSRTVTWAMVRPKLQAEMDAIRDALTTASVEAVPALQARFVVLTQVQAWFEAEALDEPISGPVV